MATIRREEPGSPRRRAGRSDPKHPSAFLLEALKTSSAPSSRVVQHSRGALVVFAFTTIDLLEDRRLRISVRLRVDPEPGYEWKMIGGSTCQRRAVHAQIG